MTTSNNGMTVRRILAIDPGNCKSARNERCRSCLTRLLTFSRIKVCRYEWESA